MIEACQAAMVAIEVAYRLGGMGAARLLARRRRHELCCPSCGLRKPWRLTLYTVMSLPGHEAGLRLSCRACVSRSVSGLTGYISVFGERAGVWA